MEDDDTLEIHPVAKYALLATADKENLGEEIYEHVSRRWAFFCPWCGRRAGLNTVRPLTLNCDHCETTSKVEVIT